MLHNMLLDLGESFGYTVIAGRGQPFPGDGLWLEDAGDLSQRLQLDTANYSNVDDREAVRWVQRRDWLAEHREYCASIRTRR